MRICFVPNFSNKVINSTFKQNAENKDADFAQQNPHQKMPKSLSPNYFNPSFGLNKAEMLSDFFTFLIAHPETQRKSIQNMKFDFDKSLTTFLRADNVVGQGTNAILYGLDKKYVIKYDLFIPVEGELRVIDNSMWNDLDIYHGSALLKYKNMSILQNITPDGKTIPAVAPNTEINPLSLHEYLTAFLYRCANLPIKAFDDMGRNFDILNQIKKNKFSSIDSFAFGYGNPNNFMISPDAIKIVDEIEDNKIVDENRLTGMLRVLLEKKSIRTQAEFEKKLVEPRRIILKNCVQASEKFNLPMPNSHISSIEHCFMLSGLENKWQKLESHINKLRDKIPNEHEERAYQLNKYFNAL